MTIEGRTTPEALESFCLVRMLDTIGEIQEAISGMVSISHHVTTSRYVRLHSSLYRIQWILSLSSTFLCLVRTPYNIFHSQSRKLTKHCSNLPQSRFDISWPSASGLAPKMVLLPCLRCPREKSEFHYRGRVVV